MSLLWSCQLLLPMLVGLPLFTAIVTILFGARAWVSGLSALLQLALATTLLVVLPEAEGLRYQLAGWGAPLGIDLVVDGFSALFLMLTAVLVLALSLYSGAYFSSEKSARFWPLWWLLVTGLNALFLAADAFNIYVTLEILGLAAVALIALEGSRQALIASLRYLFVGLVGSLSYLLGVALLYSAHGTLDLGQLALLVEPGALNSAALALISMGLLMKTAIVPLHFWLPAAHGSAPAPVSAVLSALVVKASFYLLARFWLDILAPAASDLGLQLLGVLGAIAIIWGSWQAFRAERLKLLVAYSTVAQLGYLFLLFPLSLGQAGQVGQVMSGATGMGMTGMSGAAINAVAYLVIAHAIAKAAMFLAAGNILRFAGHDRIQELQGLAQWQPISIVTFAIAGASLIGLPPSGGFIAKWLLLTTAIESGQWWWVMVILGGGLMAAAYIFRVLNLTFTETDARLSGQLAAHERLSLVMSLAGLGLAVLAVLLGFNAEWILEPLVVDRASIGALL